MDIRNIEFWILNGALVLLSLLHICRILHSAFADAGISRRWMTGLTGHGTNGQVRVRGRANGEHNRVFPIAFRECRVTFRDLNETEHSVTVIAETTMDAAALGLKRIREQNFLLDDLANPIIVEVVTATQHKVSLKRVSEWMLRAGQNPKEAATKARVREG